MKLKVGGQPGPLADAERVLGILGSARDGTSVRLDANQAWSMEDALTFCKALAAGGAGESSRMKGRGNDVDGGRGAVEASLEYLEEPLKDPKRLEEFWERSRGVVSYALDESLAMGKKAFKDDVRRRIAAQPGPSPRCHQAASLLLSPLSSSPRSGLGHTRRRRCLASRLSPDTSRTRSGICRALSSVCNKGFCEADSACIVPI